MEKKIAILGSTGAVGTAALAVARRLRLKVVSLAAKSSITLLERQALEFQPQLIAVYDKAAALQLQKKLPHIEVVAGMEGLQAAAAFADFTLLAISGSVGLIPAISAIEAGKEVGIASKEILVSAGELITKLAKEKKALLLPVDSEQSALFQVLKKEKNISRLILTASGGPFHLREIDEKQATLHPHFFMGPKIAVNSSTLMNKGLEMIGARWLFDIAPSQIETVVHPEQRVQSCVEFVDGAVLALLAEPDMELPIQYAFTYPERRPGKRRYDFIKNGTLTFLPPDMEKFRCLKLATDAMQAGRSYPCFLNGANEVLVERFLQGAISWNQIGERLEKLISSHEAQDLLTLESVLEIDTMARKQASVI